MPRNKHGYLKADALRSGIPDQYAAFADGARQEVSIMHDVRQGGFVCQHIIVRPEVREVHAWQVGERLDLARDKFRQIVTSIGGRV